MSRKKDTHFEPAGYTRVRVSDGTLGYIIFYNGSDAHMNFHFETILLNSGAKLRRVVCGTKISTTQFIIESYIHSYLLRKYT